MKVTLKSKIGIVSIVLIMTMALMAGLSAPVDAATEYDGAAIQVGDILQGGGVIKADTLNAQYGYALYTWGVEYVKEGTFLNVDSYTENPDAGEITKRGDQDLNLSTASEKWRVVYIAQFSQEEMEEKSTGDIEAKAIDAQYAIYVENVGTGSDDLDPTTGENDGNVKDETATNPKTDDQMTPIILSFIMMITLVGATIAGRAKSKL